jgi:hypothetical protein
VYVTVIKMEEVEYNGARIEEGKGRRRDPFGSLLSTCPT